MPFVALLCKAILVIVTLAMLGVFAALALRIPRQLLRRYLAAFDSRHGVGVEVGLVVLMLISFALLAGGVLQTENAALEALNAVLVAGLGAGFSLDLYLFSRLS